MNPAAVAIAIDAILPFVLTNLARLAALKAAAAGGEYVVDQADPVVVQAELMLKHAIPWGPRNGYFVDSGLELGSEIGRRTAVAQAVWILRTPGPTSAQRHFFYWDSLSVLSQSLDDWRARATEFLRRYSDPEEVEAAKRFVDDGFPNLRETVEQMDDAPPAQPQRQGETMAQPIGQTTDGYYTWDDGTVRTEAGEIVGAWDMATGEIYLESSPDAPAPVPVPVPSPAPAGAPPGMQPPPPPPAPDWDAPTGGGSIGGGSSGGGPMVPFDPYRTGGGSSSGTTTLPAINLENPSKSEIDALARALRPYPYTTALVAKAAGVLGRADEFTSDELFAALLELPEWMIPAIYQWRGNFSAPMGLSKAQEDLWLALTVANSPHSIEQYDQIQTAYKRWAEARRSKRNKD